MARRLNTGVLVGAFMALLASLACNFPVLSSVPGVSTRTAEVVLPVSGTPSQLIRVVTAVPTRGAIITPSPAPRVAGVTAAPTHSASVPASLAPTRNPTRQSTVQPPDAPILPTIPPPAPSSTPFVPTLAPPTLSSTPLPTAKAVSVEWAIFPNAASGGSTSAIYQRFEHGFMVWRSDVNCAYAIMDSGIRPVIPRELPDSPNGTSRSYRYCLMVAPLADRPLTLTPPSGLLVPVGPLGKVWGYYEEVRNALGYATQPEQDYDGRIAVPVDEPVVMGGVFYMAQLQLPNGQILACGSRAASAGTCVVGDH